MNRQEKVKKSIRMGKNAKVTSKTDWYTVMLYAMRRMEGFSGRVIGNLECQLILLEILNLIMKLKSDIFF